MDDGRYDDIIGMEHPTSARHPRMSLMDRAAQFAPFAALTGYDDVLLETGRLTGTRLELDEARMLQLNRAMQDIMERLAQRPEVRVTYFVADARKDGGEYRRIDGRVRNVDQAANTLVLADGTSIPIGDVYEILLNLQS